MATATFTYSLPTGGNSYAWSSSSNWIVNGNPNTPISGGANVTIPTGPGGAISYDDISSISLTFSTIGSSGMAPNVEIGAGNTLYIGGAGTANYGNITLDSGAAFLGANFNNLGAVNLSSNSIFDTQLLAGTGSYNFLGGGAEIFLFTSPVYGTTDTAVTNFDLSDKIYMGGNAFTNASGQYSGYLASIVNGDTLDVFGVRAATGAQNLIYSFDNFHTAADVTGMTASVVAISDPLNVHSSFLELSAVCFLEGTRIDSEVGPLPVEALRPGELVWTVAGGKRSLRPIRWIGEREIDLARHPHPEGLHPIRIRANALGERLPQRDLLVSPNHCLLLEGQLIPAKLLINGMTIVQDCSFKSVRYLHIELDSHDAVLAEGVPAETYLDVDNRRFFSNGAITDLNPTLPTDEDMLSYQDRLCAPLRLQTEEVDVLWQQLRARAVALGHIQPAPLVTKEPDLRLQADGRVFRPVARRQGHYTFVLPAASGPVRILSRSAVPTDIDRHSNDWRRLGISLERIVLRAGSQRVEMSPDHPALSDGWHSAERNSTAMWRWTSGDAELPLPASFRSSGITVELHLGSHASYAVEPVQAQSLVA